MHVRQIGQPRRGDRDLTSRSLQAQKLSSRLGLASRPPIRVIQLVGVSVGFLCRALRTREPFIGKFARDPVPATLAVCFSRALCKGLT